MRFPKLLQRKAVQTDDELFAMFGGNSGVVDPVTVPPVRAALMTIADSAASTPLNLVERNNAAKSVDHPALDLLRGHVNPWLTGSALTRDLLLAAMLHDGGQPAWVNRPNGVPVEIIHYRRGVISFQEEDTGELLYRLSGRPVNANDIVHVRAPLGKAPVTLARHAIAAEAMMERHTENFYKNGARPGGAIEYPGKIGDDELKRMRSGWRAAHESPDASGRTAILWGGAKYTPYAMTSTDAQFIENRRYQLENIARAFNISPVLLGDLTKSSYRNAEAKFKEFLAITLSPWLHIVEAAYDRALLNDDERKHIQFQFDIEDISKVDLQQRATAISSLISARVLNPNEARAWLDAGLAPYEGGDEFANPNTGASQPNVSQPRSDASDEGDDNAE